MRKETLLTSAAVIGDDKQHYYITKRLQVTIYVDPSPQRAWVKPLLESAMVGWIGNDFRRLDAAKKLWEAYDFLCFWSVEAAKRGKALPMHKCINVYYGECILKYRIHIQEMMSSYYGDGEEGHDATVVDVKGEDAGEDAANMAITAEGKGKGKMKETSDNSVAENVEWWKEGDGGVDAGSANPIPTNNPSRSIPVVSASPAPSRNAASARPRFDQPWVPPSMAARRNIAPLASWRAPQTPSEHQLNTPAAVSTPRGAVDPTGVATWRQERPSSATDPAEQQQQRFASPQDAIDWIDEQASSAIINHSSAALSKGELPAYLSFKSWATFFEQQLLSHDTEPVFDNPWFSTENTLQQFIRALHEVFHADKKSTEFSTELREWVLAVNRKLEDRKREREHHGRVATILGRTMAGWIAKEKLSVNDK